MEVGGFVMKILDNQAAKVNLTVIAHLTWVQEYAVYRGYKEC